MPTTHAAGIIPSRIGQCLGIALDIGVAGEPEDVEAAAREDRVRGGELPDEWVVVAGAVVVEAGDSVRVLAGEAIVGRHGAGDVAAATVGG